MGKEDGTRAVKVINGKSVVVSFGSAIAIVIVLVGVIAAYFAMYSDLRADVVTNGERIKAQERYFESEFEHIRRELTEIKSLVKEEK